MRNLIRILSKPLRAAPVCLLLVLGMAVQMEAMAQLNVSVEANPDPAVVGARVYVRVTVSNSGSTLSGPLRLELNYPSGLAALSDAGLSDNGNCTDVQDSLRCNPGEIVFWQLGQLGPGQGKTVSLPPTVAAGAPSMLQFEAQIFENDVAGTSAQQSVTVVEDSPLSLSVIPDQEPVLAGASLTYALLAGNRGASSIRNTELQFPMPSGSLFVSADQGAEENGGIVSWDIGTLFSGQSRRYTVTVLVDPTAIRGTLIEPNYAILTGELNFATVQARTRAVTRVAPAPLLMLGLEANPDPLSPDEPLKTRLTVTNTTQEVLTGIVVEMLYPAPLAALADSGLSDDGNCTDVTDSLRCNEGEIAYWNLGTLGPGSGRTVFLDPLLAGNTPNGSLVRLQARAFADGVPEVWERKAVATSDSRLLNLAVDPSAEPARAFSLLKYNLAIANQGAVASRDTLLRFPLPSGTNFSAANGGGTISGQEVVWQVGLLPVGESRHFQVTVEVGSITAPGSILEGGRALVSGTADLVLQESSTGVVSRTGENQRLSLAIEPNFDPIEPGEHLETRITVGNLLDEPLTGVRLEFQFAFELDRLTDTAFTDGGNCNDISDGLRCNPGEVLSWEIGTLGPGGGQSFSIPPIIDSSAGAGALVSLRARAFSDSSPSVWDRKTVVVTETRPLNLRVDTDHDPAATGDFVTYDLWYSNRGSAQVGDTELRFPLPNGVQRVAETGPARLEDNSLIWDLGQVAPGEGGHLRARVQVGGNIAEGLILTADAVTLRAEQDSETHISRAYPALRSESGIGLGVRLNNGSEAFLARGTIPSELTITNQGDSIRTGIRAALFFPEFQDRLADNAISDDGDCNDISDGLRCNPREFVMWELGNLAPGASRTVSLSPMVTANAPPGEFLRYFAFVTDDASMRSYSSVTALIGTLNGDVNGDGRTDVADMVSLVEQIEQGQVDPASDCSGDGLVDVRDIRCILELIRY